MDYVVTALSNFKSFSDVQVLDFNEYSNHTPIYFALKICTKLEQPIKLERTFHKWDPQFKNDFLTDMAQNIHLLNRSIDNEISRNCEPDDVVSLLTQFITDRANPYFEKHCSQRTESYFYHVNRTEGQKWYNETCRQKREIYNEALYNYNLNKTNDTRRLMLDAKKDYKYFCRSCKLKYSYEQGRKMSDMRKKQPREFWKLFKQKKKMSTEPEVTTEDFLQYFKSLATEGQSAENPEVIDFL